MSNETQELEELQNETKPKTRTRKPRKTAEPKHLFVAYSIETDNSQNWWVVEVRINRKTDEVVEYKRIVGPTDRPNAVACIDFYTIQLAEGSYEPFVGE